MRFLMYEMVMKNLKGSKKSDKCQTPVEEDLVHVYAVVEEIDVKCIEKSFSDLFSYRNI